MGGEERRENKPFISHITHRKERRETNLETSVCVMRKERMTEVKTNEVIFEVLIGK